MKTIKYKIVSSVDRPNGREILQDKVEKLLSEGWQCQGGVSVVSSTNNIHSYYQAMVKYDTV